MLIFYIIALLNSIDLTLTAIGLQFHIIEEQNPLMSYLWEFHPLAFIGVKLALSLLLVVCAHKLPTATIKKWRVLSTTAITLYVSVMVMHVIWIVNVI